MRTDTQTEVPKSGKQLQRVRDLNPQFTSIPRLTFLHFLRETHPERESRGRPTAQSDVAPRANLIECDFDARSWCGVSPP